MVWLKEEFGNRAFFPGPGNIEFSHEVGDFIFDLVVEGASVNSRQSLNGTATMMSPVTVTTLNSQAMTPTATSTSVGFRSTKSKSYSVRVAKATVTCSSNGSRVELHKYEQTFVDVTEDTANVNYILNVIQKKWGNNYVICTSDGIQIEDSSGTQGMLNQNVLCASDKLVLIDFSGFKFWKTPARKFFCNQ